MVPTPLSADQLALGRVVWAARAVELANWQRRAVVAIRALLDDLEPDEAAPTVAALLDLLAEEWGDDDEEADHG